MVLRAPETVVVHLQHPVLDQLQGLRVVQSPGLAIGFVEREQQLVDAIRRARVSVAFDMDGLVHEPDQLQGLAEGVRRLRSDLVSDARHLAQFGRAGGCVHPLGLAGQELGIPRDPCGQSAHSDLGGGQEVQAAQVGLGLAASLDACEQSGQSAAQQFAVAGAEVSLIRDELVVQRLRDFVGAAVGRLAADLCAELAPHVPVHPPLPDLVGNMALQMADAVGPLAGVDPVLTDPQFDHHRHPAGQFGDRARQAIVLAQIQRHRLEVLAQGQGLANDPRPILRRLEDLGKRLSPVQRDAERRSDDFAAEGREVRRQIADRPGRHRGVRPAGRSRGA